jgi:hypothetical protein
VDDKGRGGVPLSRPNIKEGMRYILGNLNKLRFRNGGELHKQSIVESSNPVVSKGNEGGTLSPIDVNILRG